MKPSLRLAAALAAALALTAPAAARAAFVTVNFTGTVTSLPDPTGVFAGAAVGEAFSGARVSDPAAAAAPPGATPAQSLSSAATAPPFAAPLGITVTLHGVTVVPRYPGAMVVTVQNDL